MRERHWSEDHQERRAADGLHGKEWILVAQLGHFRISTKWSDQFPIALQAKKVSRRSVFGDDVVRACSYFALFNVNVIFCIDLHVNCN